MAEFKTGGCNVDCSTDPRLAKQLERCDACPVRSLAVCAVLEPQEIDHLAAIVSDLDLDNGQQIFEEGEPAEHVYTVTQGAVKTSKLLPDGRCQITGFLFPGDFLGLAHGADYAFSAEALGKTHICRFTKPRFMKVLDHFPKLEHRLLSDASSELAAAHSQMLLLGRKTASEKVASFLLMLFEKGAKLEGSEDLIRVPMSRSDMADYLGLTTETVSRTITKFRKEGLIVLENDHTIRLSDAEALDDMAAGLSDAL